MVMHVSVRCLRPFFESLKGIFCIVKEEFSFSCTESCSKHKSRLVTVHAIKLYLEKLNMLVVNISECLSIEVTYLDGCRLVRVAGSPLKGKQKFCFIMQHFH